MVYYPSLRCFRQQINPRLGKTCAADEATANKNSITELEFLFQDLVPAFPRTSLNILQPKQATYPIYGQHVIRSPQGHSMGLANDQAGITRADPTSHISGCIARWTQRESQSLAKQGPGSVKRMTPEHPSQLRVTEFDGWCHTSGASHRINYPKRLDRPFEDIVQGPGFDPLPYKPYHHHFGFAFA